MLDVGVFGDLAEWIKNGASLTASLAVIALGGLVRAILVPVTVKVLNKLNLEPGGGVLRAIVYVWAFVLVLFLNWLRPSNPPIDFGALFGIAAAVAAAAIGIHQATKIKKVEPEQDDESDFFAGPPTY